MADAELKAKLSMDGSDFERGLRHASEGVSNLGRSLMSGIAAGAVIGGLKSLADEFDRIGKLAVMFNTSAESIQRVGLAADLAGVSIEQVAKTMATVGMKAREGSDAFEKLGINALSFTSLSMEDQLVAMAEAMEKMPNRGLAIAAALELIGIKGKEMLPMLLAGSQSLKEQFAGTSVVSDETVLKIEEMNDKITNFIHNLKVIAISIMEIVGAVGKLMALPISQGIGSLGGIFGKPSESKQILENLKSLSREVPKEAGSDIQDALANLGFGDYSARTIQKSSDKKSARKKLEEDMRLADAQAAVAEERKKLNDRIAKLEASQNDKINRMFPSDKKKDYWDIQMENLDELQKAKDESNKKVEEILKSIDKNIKDSIIG